MLLGSKGKRCLGKGLSSPGFSTRGRLSLVLLGVVLESSAFQILVSHHFRPGKLLVNCVLCFHYQGKSCKESSEISKGIRGKGPAQLREIALEGYCCFKGLFLWIFPSEISVIIVTALTVFTVLVQVHTGEAGKLLECHLSGEK